MHYINIFHMPFFCITLCTCSCIIFFNTWLDTCRLYYIIYYILYLVGHDEGHERHADDEGVEHAPGVADEGVEPAPDSDYFGKNIDWFGNYLTI